MLLVCVCVRERERERESVCVSRERERVCVCVSLKKDENKTEIKKNMLMLLGFTCIDSNLPHSFFFHVHFFFMLSEIFFPSSNTGVLISSFNTDFI